MTAQYVAHFMRGLQEGEDSHYPQVRTRVGLCMSHVCYVCYVCRVCCVCVACCFSSLRLQRRWWARASTLPPTLSKRGRTTIATCSMYVWRTTHQAEPSLFPPSLEPTPFCVCGGALVGLWQAIVSDYDFVETYLPAFKGCIVEGRARSIMCSYNSVLACAPQSVRVWC